MAKRWGPGNPLWEWKRKHGQSTRTKKKRRKASFRFGPSMARRYGRKKGGHGVRSLGLISTAVLLQALYNYTLINANGMNCLAKGDFKGWWAEVGLRYNQSMDKHLKQIAPSVIAMLGRKVAKKIGVNPGVRVGKNRVELI